MACTTRDDLQAELEDLEEQLDLIKTAYSAALAGDWSMYRKSFPGGSSQRIDRRKLTEIREEMQYIRAEISRIKRMLNGCSNPSVNLRRRY